MGKSASGKQEVTEYRLSIHTGFAWECDGMKRLLVDDKVIWEGDVTTAQPIYINQPELFGGPTKEGGCVGVAYFLPGRDTQVMPNVLAARWGLDNTNCPAFRGLTTVFFVGSSATNGVYGAGGDYAGGFYWTANSPFIRPMAGTFYRAPKGLNPAYAMIGPDANPIHIIYECLTDQDWGMGAPSYQFNLPQWEAVAVAIHAEAFGLSLKWTSQTEIENFVAEILDHIQATLYVNPRTGLMEIMLLRDDYDVDALREINPGNADFRNYQRKLWGETANEIVVTWTNPENEKEETVSVQDLGNIAAQGGVNSDSRNYYAVRNAELAARLAARDVRTSSAPLASCEVELDRTFWDLLPGQLLKVTWPEKKIDRLVMRAMKIEYGKKGDPGIKVQLLEDVFSLIKPPPAASPGTGWNGGGEPPAPMEFSAVMTMPLFMQPTAFSTLVYPEVVAGVLATTPGNDTLGYNLYYEYPLANGDIVWTDGGPKSQVGRATVFTPLYPEATSEIEGLPQIALGRGPVVGGFILFGDGSDTGSEIGLLQSVDDEGVWTIARGVLDTTPRFWPLDTPVWFLRPDAVIADTADIRSAGEIVDYKLLTRTSLNQLPIEDAPVLTGTMTARPHLPFRPANVKVNGTAFGNVDATVASNLVVTWSNRNRLFENGQAIAWDAASVTPEYGQETLITVYRESGAEMFVVRGLWTEATYTIPIAWVQQEDRVFVRVSSERGGLGSLQNHGFWIDNIPSGGGTPPASPVIVGAMPPPPGPDPDPTPEPLPPPSSPTPSPPPGGGGRGIWGDAPIEH